MNLYNLSSSNQTNNDTCTYEESENEAVGGVPWWTPASDCGAGIGEIEEYEGEELRYESGFDGHEHGGPGYGGGDHSDHVAAVAMVSSVGGIFKAPMDGTEEGYDLIKLVSSSIEKKIQVETVSYSSHCGSGK